MNGLTLNNKQRMQLHDFLPDPLVQVYVPLIYFNAYRCSSGTMRSLLTNTSLDADYVSSTLFINALFYNLPESVSYYSNTSAFYWLSSNESGRVFLSTLFHNKTFFRQCLGSSNLASALLAQQNQRPSALYHLSGDETGIELLHRLFRNERFLKKCAESHNLKDVLLATPSYNSPLSAASLLLESNLGKQTLDIIKMEPAILNYYR